MEGVEGASGRGVVRVHEQRARPHREPLCPLRVQGVPATCWGLRDGRLLGWKSKRRAASCEPSNRYSLPGCAALVTPLSSAMCCASWRCCERGTARLRGQGGQKVWNLPDWKPHGPARGEFFSLKNQISKLGREGGEGANVAIPMRDTGPCLLRLSAIGKMTPEGRTQGRSKLATPAGTPTAHRRARIRDMSAVFLRRDAGGGWGGSEVASYRTDTGRTKVETQTEHGGCIP